MRISDWSSDVCSSDLLVGIAQVVAGVFPGTSRSAATIFVALLAGTTNRAAATEFAFLVGIPTMFAATGYEVLSLYLDGGLGRVDRSEEGRVGQECVSTGRSRGSRLYLKKKTKK